MDGEVILIDLETGDYYSLRGAGADVWALLERGATAEAIASELLARYGPGADPETIRTDVNELLGKLRDAGVIAVDPDGPQDPMDQDSAPAPAAAGAYEAPILERYTDMQEYLLVDPIHGVDARGWPAGKAQSG